MYGLRVPAVVPGVLLSSVALLAAPAPALASPNGVVISDAPGGLFDRPPLAVEVQRRGFGGFTVFSDRFASEAAPDTCREAQAAFVRDRVSGLEAAGKRSIVAGDPNAFED